MMKFEIGAFYKRVYKDCAGEHTEYLYCTDILNENLGTEYQPFYTARLHSIEGEGHSVQCDESGSITPTDEYELIDRAEFSEALLMATVSGKADLSEAIRNYKKWKREKINNSGELIDFGF